MLVDGLNAAETETVSPGGMILITAPARGVRVYESLASRANAAALERLHVTAVYPSHDEGVNDRTSPLRVSFDREVAPEVVAAAFTISPFADGQWQVIGKEARYFPRAVWTSGVTYRWSLATTLIARDGSPLPARFDAQFVTTGSSSGVTVPGGYVCDRIARQSLAEPTGIISAPSLGPLTMLLSDTFRDRVYTLTPGGDLGHWVGDSRWTLPQGLAPDADGNVIVVDNNGLFFVDPTEFTDQRVAGSSATQAGAAAWGPATFGSQLYLCDPVGNRVQRYVPPNTLQQFATGIFGAAGLAFGPGGAWGSDLYVADANLTSIGGVPDGAGRICRVTTGGVVSTFVLNTSFLNGANSLAFDPTGAFGGNLFVADVLNKRVLQVTPAGAISVFATGFGGLRGPHCITFGPDGALYVADAGSPQVVRIARAVLTTAVPGGPATGERLSLAAAPNPFTGAVALTFALAVRSDVKVDVLDVAGRRVRSLAAAPMEPGKHTLSWDGHDDGGHPLRAGLYFARMHAGGDVRVTRIALAR